MTELLLIADDLTGTLDGAVAFVGAGVDVFPLPGHSPSVAELTNGARVVAVNADTRHMPPEEAARRVSDLATTARTAGVSFIFKKTDSALRGNVGAELGALAQACEATVHFVPAYPALGRTTFHDIQLIEGVPVAQSSFGQDPFEPVQQSCVSTLIQCQTTTPTYEVAVGDKAPRDTHGIVIYDATTQDYIEDLARQLRAGGAVAGAGCAGFAHAIAHILSWDEADSALLASGPVLALCGSLNPASQAQCDYARRGKAPTWNVSEEDKKNPTWPGTPEFIELVRNAAKSWEQVPLSVLDASAYAAASTHETPPEHIRKLVATNLGQLGCSCAAQRSMSEGYLMVMGGDVLLALVEAAHAHTLSIVGEIDTGVVISELVCRGRLVRVISKSGGFGAPDLFVKISQNLCSAPYHLSERTPHMLDSYGLKLPKAVYAGKDATQHISHIVTEHQATKICLFSDASLRKLGLIDEALKCIKAAGLTADIIDDVPAEPTYYQVEDVLAEFRRTQADMIIAIGGGSVMDTAKLVAVLATEDYTISDLLKDPMQACKQIPTLMIPTTAGTGAEVTPNAIVSVPEDEIKVGIVSDEMMADEVILDARMIKNLPRPIAASTGIDALCHAIECYTSTKANPFSDTFALEALNLILNNIIEACDNPEAMDAKRAMQLASFYAGIAITASGTTAVHALSYPLGGRYHIAHGVSNAILLVPVFRFNEPSIRDRLATAYDRCVRGQAVSVDEKSAAMIELLDSIVKHLDIPKNLGELGVENPDIDGLVEAGMSVQRLLVNNVRTVTPDDARAIYEQIM